MRTLISLLLLAVSAPGATKLILSNTASLLKPPVTTAVNAGCNVGTNTWAYLLAGSAQGSSTQTWTWAPPNGCTPPATMQSASGGTMAYWFSAPINSGGTLSGNANYSYGCGESAIALNYGPRFTIYRWNPRLGIVPGIIDQKTSVECTNSVLTLTTITAAAMTGSATFVTGDRIVIVVEAMNIGTFGANGSRTLLFGYGGAAAGTGDTFVNFVTPTFTFSADSNNTVPMVARMWDWWLCSLS
jgi:hypothetical protein